MSDWQVHPPFTSRDLNALQMREDSSFCAVSADGQLFQGEFNGATVPLARVDAPLLAIALLEGNEILCCGRGGTVLLYGPADTQVQEIPERPRLCGTVSTGPEGALVVGCYDEASGAIFRYVRASNALLNVTPISIAGGLRAIAGIGPDTFLVAGHRGYLAIFTGGEQRRIPTGTEHPLRTIGVLASDVWLVGGGGWAQDMPVLLEGNQEEMRPLISAHGDRVIVGIAPGDDGRTWIAESHSDGAQWHGRVWELRDGKLRSDSEFPGQGLRGIACRHDRLAVCGANGLLAWKRTD